MTLVDLVGTVAFLVALVGALWLLVLLVVQLVRRRGARVRRLAQRLLLLVAGYGAVLATVALAMPRRVLAPGTRECFDDWCVAAVAVRAAGGEEGVCSSSANVWLVTVEVSSRAKRVRQRAADAEALVEDRAGARYRPCAPALAPLPEAAGTGEPPGAGVAPSPAQRWAPSLRDRLGPGESFRVLLPYALPAGRQPVGVVIRHGAFPGALIVGADQAALHRPTLLRL